MLSTKRLPYVLGPALLYGAVGRVAAHPGTVESATGSSLVPTWYVILAGGTVVSMSFLFTSMMADHEVMRMINRLGLSIPVPSKLGTAGTWLARAGALGVVGLVVYVGLVGPASETTNFAVLFVWTGWWSGYAMSTYLLGDSWPALNPWRALTAPFPSAGLFEYPERAGAWPAVVGLLAVVWIEVVSPFAERPPMLAALVAGYTLVTVAGAVAFGPGTWFRYADPLANTFRAFGRIAPVGRTANGLELSLPSVRAARIEGDATPVPGETAFVVGLLWITTYDGVVSTPTWERAVGPLVAAGVPAVPVYLLALVGGFWLFYRLFGLAARKSREAADTYVTADAIEEALAPSLLPIAAGYHVAHFSPFVLALWPALTAVAASPLSPPTNVSVIVLPAWFGQVRIAAILVGHMLGVWVAHSISFDLFPGALQPIRSQFPFILVMIFYTLVSMWIVVTPGGPVPFV